MTDPKPPDAKKARRPQPGDVCTVIDARGDEHPARLRRAPTKADPTCDAYMTRRAATARNLGTKKTDGRAYLVWSAADQDTE